MLDSRERFTAAADLYHLYRPSYPGELVDWILETSGRCPPACIADLGCGTGISTRLFAERGFEVIGIDPNESMLAKARQAGGARYQKGEAAATGLSDGSVDLAIAAQAFHWFDTPATLAELGRVLRPQAWCAAFWNLRSLATAFMSEYDGLLRRFSREYEVAKRPLETTERLRRAAGIAEVRETEFASLQPLDGEGFRGRVYSSSYVVHGVADQEGFARALAAIFDRHQQGGRVEFRYRTIAIAFRLNPLPGSSAPGPAKG